MATNADFASQTWIENSGSDYCASNKTDPRCDVVPGHYQYSVDLVPNAVFLGVFGASFIGFAATWAVTRRATAFNVALLLGLLCELLGYAGRILSWDNRWDDTGFLMQICCLTIGPAFMAAGIYLCLRRIVSAFGAENSRIPPAYYTRIFIPCDVISLVLQALGGALASIATTQSATDLGSHVMVAGLSFQVVTLLVFIAASLDFALRVWRRQRSMGSSALDQDPVLVHMRGTFLFKGFLGALALSTLCILWRSAFRVAELSEGWNGPIMGDQPMFIGFEGVLVAAAVIILNVFHPAICIRPLLEGGGGLTGLWCLRRKNKLQPSKSLNDFESLPLSDNASV